MENAMVPRVQIVGAGVGGLALACHLSKRNIPYKIFDRGPKPNGHNYGITLYRHESLLQALGISFEELIEKTAVTKSANSSSLRDEKSFVASDRKLRDFLNRHPVSWNHKVVSSSPTSSGLQLTFENGATSTAAVTVDASGLNSPFLDITPEVLPYAVYHGTRYVKGPVEEYETKSPRIQLSCNAIKGEHAPKSLNFSPEEQVYEIRYTFSRPARKGDPLFNPNRSKQAAKDIPPEFYEESGPPKGDRILNWLMRVKVPSPQQIRDCIKKGILLIGDAAHGLPILGSEGANLAIEDAAAFNEDLEAYYESRKTIWEEAEKLSKERLIQMHNGYPRI